MSAPQGGLQKQGQGIREANSSESYSCTAVRSFLHTRRNFCLSNTRKRAYIRGAINLAEPLQRYEPTEAHMNRTVGFGHLAGQILNPFGNLDDEY